MEKTKIPRPHFSHTVFSILLPIIYLFLTYIYPMYRILLLSLGYGIQQKALTTKYFLEAITQKQFTQALIFTFEQAIITTIIALILGVPAGYFLARYEFPFKNALQDLLTIPFLLPSVVMLLGLVLAFGPDGFMTRLSISIFGKPFFSLYGTLSGIIIAHLIYNLSVIIRVTETGWISISEEEEAVAKTLGASHTYFLLKVGLPKIINYVKTAALLVFIYCFNSFAMVLALGEVRYKTIEVLTYENARVRLRFHEAAAITIIQLIINIIIITLYLKQGEKIQDEDTVPKKEEFLKLVRGNIKRKLLFLSWITYLSFVLFLSLIPIYAVFKTSFFSPTTNKFTIENYLLLFSSRYEPLLGTSLIHVVKNSLLIAVSVTFITLIISIPLARYFTLEKVSRKSVGKQITYRLLSIIIILPMATSAISLSLGVAIAYQQLFFYQINVGLLIIIAQSLVALPFVYRMLVASYEQISSETIHVAKTLGGSNIQIFTKIELPHLLPALLTASVFSFAISLGEFGATYFLARTEWTTMSIAVYKLIISRNIGLPSAMATIMILISFIAFRLISSTQHAELKV